MGGVLVLVPSAGRCVRRRGSATIGTAATATLPCNALTVTNNTRGMELTLNIVDADIGELRKLIHSGRARSAETLKLINAIESLKPGQAKALLFEPGDTVSALRSKLGYAARAAGVKLRTASDGSRLIFALQNKSSSAVQNQDGASERKELVRSCALELANSGQHVLSAEDVLGALPKDAQIFQMPRPATVVGAILRSMPEFVRVAKNRFQFEG